jgi:hypothetical protein
MIEHFQTLLAGIVANPQAPIGNLPLLTAQEQHQLLVEWNNTLVDYPQDKCIHQLIEQQVKANPDAVAVVFEGQQLTYRDLNSSAKEILNNSQCNVLGLLVNSTSHQDDTNYNHLYNFEESFKTQTLNHRTSR